MQPGDKVYLIGNPGRVGTLRNETDGVGARQKVLVDFDDGSDGFFLPGSLAKADERPRGPVNMVRRGSFGFAADLRGAVPDLNDVTGGEHRDRAATLFRPHFLLGTGRLTKPEFSADTLSGRVKGLSIDSLTAAVLVRLRMGRPAGPNRG